jgi:hypothetical protein
VKYNFVTVQAEDEGLGKIMKFSIEFGTEQLVEEHFETHDDSFRPRIKKDNFQLSE